MNTQLDNVLDRLDGIRKNGRGYTARCPAHNDRNPSLSVGTASDGKILLHCHAGCTYAEVMTALGLDEADGFPDDTDPSDWNPWKDGEEVAVYPYTDAAGEVLFEVVRFEVRPGHPAWPDKEFKQRAPGKGWGRKKYGLEPVLYRLPSVLRAAETGRVVFVVEGEKDVETLEEVGLVTTCNLQGSGEWRDRYADDLDGAHVVVLPDNDDPGREHAEAVAASCYNKAHSVCVLQLPGLAHKGDVTDWMEAGGTREELERLVNDAPEWEPSASEPNEGDDAGEKEEKDTRTQAQVLLDLAADVELFHTPDDMACASFVAGGRQHTVSVRSSSLTNYLRGLFYAERGKPPSSQALQDTRDMLATQAEFDGEEREVYVRIAGHASNIYVDLANDGGEVIEIAATGWRIIRAENAPVRFRRPKGLKPLPTPERGGSLDLLLNHVRVTGGEFALLLGFLVQSLRPTGPYPPLVFVGEQGTGKTTAARMIRALVDPSHVLVRTRARNEHDLMIAASNGWVLAFDNLSGLPVWMSDAFCRFSTGGGFGTRTLYENRQEELFKATRPLLLNGIEDLTTRPDLADRALVLELQPIPKSERKTEREVWEAFDADAPAIIGALFDAVSAALASDKPVPRDLPRMADFADWANRAEEAFPVAEGTFLQAYHTNRNEQSENAVANNTVATAIRKLLAEQGEWTGKTSELLEDMKAYLPNPEKPPKDYPESHQALTAVLRRIMPVLRAVGIERKDGLGKKGREFRLSFMDDAGGDDDSAASGGSGAFPAQSTPNGIPPQGDDSQAQSESITRASSHEGELPLDYAGISPEAPEPPEKWTSQPANGSGGCSGAPEGSGRHRNANRPSRATNGIPSGASGGSGAFPTQSIYDASVPKVIPEHVQDMHAGGSPSVDRGRELHGDTPTNVYFSPGDRCTVSGMGRAVILDYFEAGRWTCHAEGDPTTALRYRADQLETADQF